MKRMLALLTAAGLATGVAACGGSKHASTTTTQTTSQTVAVSPAGGSTSHKGSSTSPAPSSHSSSGAASSGQSSGSASSSTPRSGQIVGDKSVTHFGQAAGGEVQKEITDTVTRYYAKLSSGDANGACAMLGKGIKRQLDMMLSRAPTLKGRGCAGLISAFFNPRNPNAGASLSDVHVLGARVKGDRAFALISTRASRTSALLVVREGGSWKINTLVGFPLAP